MLKIDLNNSIEDVQIGERVFKLDTSDEKLRSYIDKYNGYSEKEKEIRKQVESIGDDITTDQFDQLHSNVKEVLLETLDFILEEGSFDYVYGVTKSVNSCADVLTKLMTHVNNKIDQSKMAKYEEYTGNKVKKSKK